MGSPHKRPTTIGAVDVSAGEILSQFNQRLRLDTAALVVWIFGGYVVIDVADLPLLEGRRWNVKPHRQTAYVIYNGRSENLRLHRLMLPTADEVDHKNGIGWDNRRCNLRPTDDLGNSRNHRVAKSKVGSKYKGVTYDSAKRLYRARIMVSGKSIGLGRFKLEENAAAAYDAAAKRYFGEFAVLNLT